MGTANAAWANVVLKGKVYGGGENASVNGNASIDVTNGTMQGIFGGGQGQTTEVRQNVKVIINGEDVSVGSDIYGGSALGSVNTRNEDPETVYRDYTTSVTLKKGNVDGNIYGGGLGSVDGDGVKAMGYGDVSVSVEGGTAAAVYGCNNLNGSPTKLVNVNIKGGTVSGDVYGGGNLADAGTMTDNVNPIVTISGGTVGGDVYGGGALAAVMGNTEVALYGGDVRGNVYGGGLGQVGIGMNGDPGYVPSIKASVSGDTHVNLGMRDDKSKTSAVYGSIFGCNNVNGSPDGHAKVDIYWTKAKGTPDEKYHVYAVYGGGNKADYMPTADEVEFSEVTVWNCSNCIEYVYGGSNAASVPASQLTVWGCDSIGYTFGGGNGYGTSDDPDDPGFNPGANVGTYKDQAGTVHEYGKGTARSIIHGGRIVKVYGGSNTKGLIRQEAILDIAQEGGCEFKLGDVYAAGNEADMFCSGTVNVGCIEVMDELYGGANAADVNGDVTLNVTSGTINKVFGGNKTSGKLSGSITVNIDEIGCSPIKIGQLYGCGNKAAYSIYGYDADGNPLDHKQDTVYADPVINVISCTRIDTIFGGGLGESAVVYGSPRIIIDQIPGRYSTDIDADGDGTPDDNEKQLGSIGTVYGGGNQADVHGDTNVEIGTNKDYVTHIEADYGSSLAGVNITGNVYGGGKGDKDDPNKAKVHGKTHVTVGRK